MNWPKSPMEKMYQSALRYGSSVMKAYSCLDIVNFLLSNLISVSKYIVRIIRKLTLCSQWLSLSYLIPSSNSFYSQHQSWFTQGFPQGLCTPTLNLPAEEVTRLVTNPQNLLDTKVSFLRAPCKVPTHSQMNREEPAITTWHSELCQGYGDSWSMFFQRPLVTIGGPTAGMHPPT